MNNDYWKTECSKLRFGIKGDILPNLDAWEKAIQVYAQSWYWAYTWMINGCPAPPVWFFTSRDKYLEALSQK